MTDTAPPTGTAPPTDPAPSTGLSLILGEMARQRGDALGSLADPQVQARARDLAHAARDSGRLLLLGMGASHFVNRMAEPEYRRLGLDATAMPLSEALYTPLPPGPRAALIASQSGASGEVGRYLQTPAQDERRFGLTLDPHSPLAQALPCLIGPGGAERGFAATRSLVLSVALHAAVLEALGQESGSVRAALESPDTLDLTPALDTLRSADTLVFVGRAELTGLAEVCALHAAELARVPALGFEGGQFRHGPIELLRPGLGVVLLRTGGPSADLTDTLARQCVEAGLRPVVLDCAGGEAVPGTVWLALAPGRGLAAVLNAVFPLQRLLLDFASDRVRQVGKPRHARKVTLER
ncbi:SIS domain-containing protein [Deinococcus koreensis]|uniref:Glutamine--fructose-6-phosphate aminotransferase [isomerizing] n=1 Tax=Deinococcus koreensis TaxID=2054903 RepID=A0A2K3UT01_9DEIO|nr:SIS domain-containing protein [Deinococcus koreensis]PNY79648.1 phosphosugar isomerase [Deinococcus koreensis]